MFALACYAPLRSLAAAGLAGGWLGRVWGAHPVALRSGRRLRSRGGGHRSGSELFRRYTRTDRHVIVLSGIVPLLPGLIAYRGFYSWPP